MSGAFNPFHAPALGRAQEAAAKLNQHSYALKKVLQLGMGPRETNARQTQERRVGKQQRVKLGSECRVMTCQANPQSRTLVIGSAC